MKRGKDLWQHSKIKATYLQLVRLLKHSIVSNMNHQAEDSILSILSDVRVSVLQICIKIWYTSHYFLLRNWFCCKINHIWVKSVKTGSNLLFGNLSANHIHSSLRSVGDPVFKVSAITSPSKNSLYPHNSPYEFRQETEAARTQCLLSPKPV